INKSWLGLENFMRIFRQQGHPWTPQEIWFAIKSKFDRIEARATNGRARIRTMSMQTPKLPEADKRRRPACCNWAGGRRQALSGTPVDQAPCRLTLERVTPSPRTQTVQVAG